MRMRRHAVCGGEKRYTTVPQPAPQVASQTALATITNHGGDGNVPMAPKPSQLNQPSLIVHGGPQDGATIHISKPAVTMGYLPDNDIVVVGPRVSRRHAEIVRMDAGFHIWDLGISNGTFVNQQHIGEMTYPLQHGDQIRLANSNIYHVFSYVEALSRTVELSYPVEETLNLISRVPEFVGQREILETISGGGQSHDERQGTTEEPAPRSEKEVYEGNVKLQVEWDGQIQVMIEFVSMLRGNPQVRVVRLVGNSPTEVEISLALREPLLLEQMLAQMEEVAQLTELHQETNGPGGPERVLEVRLIREFSQVLPPNVDRSRTKF